MLHEAAKGITHLTRRRHTKRNDLITRKRATHRNQGVHRQLIKTIRAQERRHTRRDTVAVACQQLATLSSTPAWRISAPGAGGSNPRHIQVMNTGLSLQMSSYTRARRSLRTLIQARMLLAHNRLRALRANHPVKIGVASPGNRHRQTVNISARILRIRRSHQTPRRCTRHSVTVHRRGAIVGHRHHRINIIRK